MDHSSHIVERHEHSAVTTAGDAAAPTHGSRLIVLAAYHLAWRCSWRSRRTPSSRAIGPFGTLNRHYLRDSRRYEAAVRRRLPGGDAVRPSWRVPVLAMTTVQFALHTVNHLVDIGSAHPRWTGYFDFFSLLAARCCWPGCCAALARGGERARRAPDPGHHEARSPRA